LQAEKDGEAEAVGLTTKIIPKGIYLAANLPNWESNVPDIGKHFNEVLSRSDVVRANALCVELYNADGSVDLLVTYA
jgi:hypothetical protein